MPNRPTQSVRELGPKATLPIRAAEGQRKVLASRALLLVQNHSDVTRSVENTHDIDTGHRWLVEDQVFRKRIAHWEAPQSVHLAYSRSKSV